MNKERSLTEQSVLRTICNILSNDYLSDIRESDIKNIASKIDQGLLSLSFLNGLNSDELFDFVGGQLRLF